MVIERDDVEDEVRDIRLGGAEQRFGAAGAILEMEPDDGRPLVRPIAWAISRAEAFSVSASPTGAVTISALHS